MRYFWYMLGLIILLILYSSKGLDINFVALCECLLFSAMIVSEGKNNFIRNE